MRSLKNITGLCILSLSVSGFAANVSKVNCIFSNVLFKGKVLYLNVNEKPQMSHVYFIKNTSSQTITLNHPQQGGSPHAGAGWGSAISPNQWSAILLSKGNFMMNCTTMVKNKVTQVNCSRVISVCLASLQTQTNDSYWLVENAPWKNFIDAVKNKLHGNK